MGKKQSKNQLTAELIFLGNELLIGHTVNTNLTEIAKELNLLSIKVVRSTTVIDDVTHGKNVIRESLNRAPDIIIIGGGLGPTYDDIQLQTLASALNIKIEINSEALNQVSNYYDQMGFELTEARKKMAYLPSGSKPLKNIEGAAPGVFTRVKTESGQTVIFSVPGVPIEMRYILQYEVIPLISKIIDERNIDFVHKEKVVAIRGIAESSLAPLIQKWVDNYPNIRFKSHPINRENASYIHLQIISYQVENLNEVSNQIYEEILAEFPNCEILIKEE
ncbi:MAG: competence damage-inducible protein A [Candidatus Heimdallarchaeota archaeon]|nr:competence damage-inducible protein A [Candidatus Heimdallarchaeota archaeon]MCK5047754.1 competence damage-inducible protein A [Candidatus Heimdallarchaeota archaeon]